jgi:hypothetical protein
MLLSIIYSTSNSLRLALSSVTQQIWRQANHKKTPPIQVFSRFGAPCRNCPSLRTVCGTHSIIYPNSAIHTEAPTRRRLSVEGHDGCGPPRGA